MPTDPATAFFHCLPRMGHSSITVTMDVYGGLFSGFDEGVADAFDEAFSASFVSDSCQIRDSDVIELPGR